MLCGPKLLTTAELDVIFHQIGRFPKAEAVKVTESYAIGNEDASAPTPNEFYVAFHKLKFPGKSSDRNEFEVSWPSIWSAHSLQWPRRADASDAAPCGGLTLPDAACRCLTLPDAA